MSMTVEQFLSFSESEQLQTVKELNDTGNVKTIIDVLTSVGIENLSISLLGELGRAYNNNGNEKEAIKVLESIDEEYRDAVWYYRCAYAYGAIALDNNESYTSDTMKQMLRLVDQGVRLAQEKNLDDIKSYCFEVIDMCYMQMDFEQCEAEYPELCKAYSQYVTEKKRNIILLSYFMDMADGEISHFINIPRSNVQYHRTKTLEAMRKIMEERK